jgi:hypothetical protein
MDDKGNDVVDNIEENVNEVEGNVNEVEENENEVEGNVVGQGNIDISLEDSDQNNAHEVNNLVGDAEVNDMDEVVIDVINNIEENENENKGNINYEALQNLSVEEALAFFSS